MQQEPTDHPPVSPTSPPLACWGSLALMAASLITLGAVVLTLNPAWLPWATSSSP